MIQITQVWRNKSQEYEVCPKRNATIFFIPPDVFLGCLSKGRSRETNPTLVSWIQDFSGCRCLRNHSRILLVRHFTVNTILKGSQECLSSFIRSQMATSWILQHNKIRFYTSLYVSERSVKKQYFTSKASTWHPMIIFCFVIWNHHHHHHNRFNLITHRISRSPCSITSIVFSQTSPISSCILPFLSLGSRFLFLLLDCLLMRYCTIRISNVVGLSLLPHTY